MRTREQILSEWDANRAKIASGCTNDGPRLWLEGVLDDYDEAVQDAERRARHQRNLVTSLIEEVERKLAEAERLNTKHVAAYLRGKAEGYRECLAMLNQ